MKLLSTLILVFGLVGLSLAQKPNIATDDIVDKVTDVVGGAATNLGAAVGTITALKTVTTALKAPLVAGYQIAREVLILIALIFFVKFLLSSVDIDLKGLLDGKHEYEYDHGYSSSGGYGSSSGYAKRSLSDSIFDLPVVQRLAAQVNEAIEKYN